MPKLLLLWILEASWISLWQLNECESGRKNASRSFTLDPPSIVATRRIYLSDKSLHMNGHCLLLLGLVPFSDTISRSYQVEGKFGNLHWNMTFESWTEARRTLKKRIQGKEHPILQSTWFIRTTKVIVSMLLKSSKRRWALSSIKQLPRQEPLKVTSTHLPKFSDLEGFLEALKEVGKAFLGRANWKICNAFAHFQLYRS